MFILISKLISKSHTKELYNIGTSKQLIIINSILGNNKQIIFGPLDSELRCL